VARFKCRRVFCWEKTQRLCGHAWWIAWERGLPLIETKPTKRAAISCQRSGGRSFFFSVGKYVISTPACRNPRFPDAIRKLTPITQLYISQSLGAVHPSKRLSVQEGHRRSN
jgi:hypothetical protein